MPPPASQDEETLAARARSGDSEALLALLDEYDGLMRLRVGQILPTAIRRRVAVADVLQETRLEVVGSIERFEWRGAGSFRAWLMQIATHQARRAIRHHLTTAKRSQRHEVTRPRRLDTAVHAVHAETPSQVAMGNEARAMIRRALDLLPPDYREVLRLCREEGMTTRHAALHMGRSREATKKLYGRALARLTDILEKLQGECDA